MPVLKSRLRLHKNQLYRSKMSVKFGRSLEMKSTREHTSAKVTGAGMSAEPQDGSSLQ